MKKEDVLEYQRLLVAHEARQLERDRSMEPVPRWEFDQLEKRIEELERALARNYPT